MDFYVLVLLYKDTIKKGKGVPLHAKQAQRGGSVVALPILEPGARRGWELSVTPQLQYPQ